MHTAAIPYRVADFLKQHPPFQFIDDAELVPFAARGRVRFHEADEYICWQGAPQSAFIYVIQQGTVSFWDESADRPILRDLRSVGDLIGVERFNGASTNLHSVKAGSDVILYAFPAETLETLVKRNDRAARFVAAYSSVTAGSSATGESANPHEMFVADLVLDRQPAVCNASTPIREAARILCESGAQALAIGGKNGIAGILTSTEFLRWIGDGAVNAEQPALNIAHPTTATAAPQTLVSDCVLAMVESRASAVALTSDGSPSAALHGIITASSLAPAFGDHPITLAQEIAAASNLESLQRLNMRVRAWLLANLAMPSAVDWLAPWADLVNRRILERLLRLTGRAAVLPLCCFYGAAGRQELLTAVVPSIAVIGAEDESMEAALSECGFLDSGPPPVCASLEDWKSRYSKWIRDPILSGVYEARSFFDLRPVAPSSGAFRELASHISTELAAEPAFLHIVANDCLARLPPITLFRDLVVEESGEQTDMFQVEASVLAPLADVGRVFSLACGTQLGASTCERFVQARRMLPSHDAIFREASEAMRVALYCQGRAGLRSGSSGAELPLNTLSRHDRHLLKGGFRSIQNLLEFTASRNWVEAL